MICGHFRRQAASLPHARGAALLSAFGGKQKQAAAPPPLAVRRRRRGGGRAAPRRVRARSGTKGEDMQINDVELPLGFSVALSKNANAMSVFHSLTGLHREEILEKARGASSKEELDAIIRSLDFNDG